MQNVSILQLLIIAQKNPTIGFNFGAFFVCITIDRVEAIDNVVGSVDDRQVEAGARAAADAGAGVPRRATTAARDHTMSMPLTPSSSRQVFKIESRISSSCRYV